jgi:glycosyltransferase involved in cell wall biosynthesis
MSLPNKLFEYLMAGLPVLSTPLEAIADISQRYDVGRVAPSLDPADIAAALNALLADQDALEHMRRNALAAVQNDLCWEKEQQRLIQLYQRILTTPSS